MNDHDLMLQLAATGDPDIWGEIYSRHHGRITRYLEKRLWGRSAHLVDDICQIIFVRVYTKRKKYGPERRFLPWLYVVARNEMVSRCQAYHRHSGVDIPVPELVDEHVEAVEKPDPLTLIDPEHHPLLHALYWEGESLRGAARKLGIGKDAAYFRLKKALKQARHAS
jgi:RNA polymerase sigma factor (sigma-70 family)